ncbi:MAG: DNA repair protein RadA [Clostridia bacterium]|nr:DNA repair protein RadA [Clostridia bacterium]
MPKNQIIYVCSQCGNESPKWLGKCPACGSWNTYYEEKIVKEKGTAERKNITSQIVKLSEVPKSEGKERVKTGYDELDRVLGGGLVPGSLILLGGEPGIGKSTLILQICDKVKFESGPTLYISGEESGTQISLRAERLKINNDNIMFLGEANIELIEEAINDKKPAFIIIDSIQTMYSSDIPAAPGSVSQVREITAKIMKICKQKAITTVIIGHVTKDGTIAGPRVLEHMVDTVLYLEGERYFSYRMLRGVKNRFGSTNEVGLFEMREEGMVEVTNPSELLISERDGNPAGSVIVATLEGTRSMLIELQALVARTAFGLPRRTGQGVEYNRLVLLIAVLEKKLGMQLSDQDAYVNVVGGMRLDEPAADLGIALAVVSSFKNIPLPKDLVAIGEIGLTGEVRVVNSIEKRIKEAEKLGFKTCLIPQNNKKQLKYKGNINIIGVANVNEAMKTCNLK